MEIFNLLPIIYAKLLIYILAFTRIAVFLNAIVIFRRWIIAQRTIVGLTSVLAVYIVLLDPAGLPPLAYSSSQLFFMMLLQSVLGIMAAFILNLTFEVFFITGQIISSQIGLSMASQFDPRFGNITSLTHFYVISATLIFFMLNGHLILIKSLVDSFQTIPLDHTIISRGGLSLLFDYSQIIFSDAVLLSLSVICTALISNLALSFVTKFAPQFNLFSVGININLVLGLAVVYFTYLTFVGLAGPEIDHAIGLIARFFKG